MKICKKNTKNHTEFI